MDFETLHKQQLLERKSSALTSISETFFQECVEMLDARKAMLKTGFSIEALSFFENAFKAFQELVTRRQHKIILKALSDGQEKAFSVDGLALEEAEFYSKLLDLLNSYRLKLAEMAEKGVERKKIVFIKDLDEEVVGSDKKAYGPFKKGDELLVPLKVADKLLKQGFAEAAQKA